MLTEEILDTQRALENSSLEVGARRYLARQDQKAEREGFDRRDDVAKMIRGGIPVLSQALKVWAETAGAAKGRRPSGFKAITMLDPDLVAYVALSRMFRELPKGGRVADIVTGIGQSLQVELEAKALTEADPKAAKRFRDLAEGEASETVLRRRHEAAKERAGVELNWARSTQAGVGQTVLGVALLALRDIFMQETCGDASKGKQSIVRLTDEALTTLANMEEAASWLKPLFQPMLTLPRPWTTLGTGCYHDPRLSKLVPLVRTYSGEHKRLLREAIRDGSMREVLDAVNAIQETRWAIDGRVLRMVRWCREQGLRPSDSFPAAAESLPELPRKLSAVEWAETEPAKRTALSRNRKAIRDIRAAAGVDAGVFAIDLETAEFLNDHEFFCLPHSLDFRGRVYAVPHFNHQRSDHMKGMFHFADGVPIGAEGGDWLMIHLANCGDFGKASKKPFADRIAWVRANEGAILEAARYPEETYDWWSTADSPFCFLQACFEYDAWMQSGFSPDFLSTIAIAADGSCSGLQHYAALTRSAQEAHHVNLTPRDDVGDIYQVVADAAVPSIKLTALKDDTTGVLARIILDNGFGRSEVKRNVMTYFYGSGRFGMRDQHMEDTMRPLADKVAMGELPGHPYAVVSEKTGNLDGGYGCAQIMAAHVYDAVVRVAPKADEAASWIQAVAATLAHESLSMVWRTPTGMPVVQRYSEYTSKVVNTWLYDRKVRVPSGMDRVADDGSVLTRVQLLIREAPTKRVEKKRMRSASSPNVVHSMDGSHLQRSVAMGRAAGIQHFAMIHDSFGTHAGNMTLFARVIREAFISVYEDYCPLAELDRQAREVLSPEGASKLPPIPAKGDLDLGSLRASLYAFA